MFSSAIAAALLLAGCGVDRSPPVNTRHTQPLSDKALAELDARNMSVYSAILLRIFKEESELEVWKENNTGRFELLRTYATAGRAPLRCNTF
jgi:murein L,D-transpeptidase YafK